jgi:hypothetical protein
VNEDMSGEPIPRRASALRGLVTSVIDGAPVAGGRTLPSTNPARLDEVVGEVSFGDASTFVRAAESAEKAQEEWAAIPAPIRGRAIAHIGRLIEENAEALARLVTAEIGKPYGEALGEVREIIDTCDFFLGEGRRLYGQTVPSEMPDKQLFTFRRPVGTVAVITAGNFPVAVPAWYIVPALLAGNTVVQCGVSRTVRTRRRAAGWCIQCHARRRRLDILRAGAGTGSWPGRQGGLHRIVWRRSGDWWVDRALPPDCVLGAGRQEPAARHAECRS